MNVVDNRNVYVTDIKPSDHESETIRYEFIHNDVEHGLRACLAISESCGYESLNMINLDDLTEEDADFRIIKKKKDKELKDPVSFMSEAEAQSKKEKWMNIFFAYPEFVDMIIKCISDLERSEKR